ncbi:cytosine permease [Burkholderia oklahomensis EO147]|nr:cytosine permease [Burkholderia oklahomensis EO147]KUY51593.1 cytosine permease [Burkholderia oklahomensis EO147]
MRADAARDRLRRAMEIDVKMTNVAAYARRRNGVTA